MIQKSTDELNDLLEKVKPSQIDRYLKENKKYLKDDKKAFYYYVKEVLDAKRIKLKDVYLKAGVSETFGSKILRMEKHTSDRDLILRMCLAGRFNWEETNRALKLYGMCELYSRDSRDACVIVAINNRMYDIIDVDALMKSKGLKGILNDTE